MARFSPVTPTRKNKPENSFAKWPETKIGHEQCDGDQWGKKRVGILEPHFDFNLFSLRLEVVTIFFQSNKIT